MKWNKNENIMYQNLWHAVKSVHRGEFIASDVYIRKDFKSII